MDIVDAIRQTIELSARRRGSWPSRSSWWQSSTARHATSGTCNLDRSDAYQRYKIYLGKALLLGLEFLVAADIVRTVALDPTLPSVSLLGLLVVVLTFLELVARRRD